MAYLKTLLLLIIMIFFSATTYAADCIDGSRTEQGTGLIVEGDCVEPPILPYPEKYDCGTGMKLIQGTVDSCIAATETNDPGIWLPSCSAGFQLTQGTMVCVDMPNRAPVANAGTDQNINNTTLVTLDGNASTDIDEDPLTYFWTFNTKPGTSTATLSDTTAINPTFTANVDGTYEIELVVNDGFIDSAVDTVVITVSTYADIITPAIDKIGAYADDQNQPSPTVQDYIDAGITGVDTENLDDVNSAVAAKSSSEVDTTEEIQAIVDEVNVAIAASDDVLEQIGAEGDTGDTTNSVVTVAQLDDIVGLTDVVAGNEAAYQDYIDSNPDLFSTPATLAEVQAMIDAVNASEVAKAASNAVLSQIGLEADNPDSVNAIVTVAQLSAIFPALTDINSTYETAYQDYIDANPDAFASPATPAEVQAMIDAVNIEQGVPIVGIKKTGEVNSYAIGDDGYYQKGEDRTYTSISTGIVLDNVTGLMWQTDGFASGDTGKIFNVAVSYCSNLTLGGYDNWRLPSINELQSIVHNIYGYDRVFGNGRLGKYSGLQGKHWSSTPALGLVDTMMVVTFFEYSGYYVDFVNYIGTTGASSKNVHNNTLCVRNQ